VDKIRGVDAGEVFYNRIEALIKNILVDNINYKNGYYNEKSLHTFKKDTIERSKFILEEMEDMKHLIVKEEEMEEVNAVKIQPESYRINFENKRKEKRSFYFEDLIGGECFYVIDNEKLRYLLMKMQNAATSNNNAIYLLDGSVCRVNARREITPVKARMIIEE